MELLQLCFQPGPAGVDFARVWFSVQPPLTSLLAGKPNGCFVSGIRSNDQNREDPAELTINQFAMNVCRPTSPSSEAAHGRQEERRSPRHACWLCSAAGAAAVACLASIGPVTSGGMSSPSHLDIGRLSCQTLCPKVTRGTGFMSQPGRPLWLAATEVCWWRCGAGQRLCPPPHLAFFEPEPQSRRPRDEPFSSLRHSSIRRKPQKIGTTETPRRREAKTE